MGGGPGERGAGERAGAAARRIVSAQESGLVLVILLMVLGLTLYGAANPKPKNVGVRLGAGDQAVLIARTGAETPVGVPLAGELDRVEVRRAGAVVHRFAGATDAHRWHIEETPQNGGVPARELKGRVEVNKFFEAGNLVLLANNASFVAVIAVGMTAVIVLAGIDLSVGSLYALAAVLTAMVVNKLDPSAPWWVSVPAALVVSMLVGGALGFANGAMIVGFRLHPFIITLGTMSVYRGIAFLATEGQTIGGLPDSLQTGFFKLAPFGGAGETPVQPVNTAIMGVLAVVGTVVLGRTVFGRRVYAIGGNETAARYAGVPVGRVKLWVYTLVGVLTGLSACMYLGYYGAATSSAGTMLELRVIAAAVIGGASLTGGRGTALGAVLGAIIIELIANAISILNIDNAYLQVVTGGAIIVAVVIDRVKRGFEARGRGA